MIIPLRDRRMSVCSLKEKLGHASGSVTLVRTPVVSLPPAQVPPSYFQATVLLRFPLRPRLCIRTFFHCPLALSVFLVEADEEVFEIVAGLFLFLVCNLGQQLSNTSAAVKHDSSIAAFTMADGFDPSGLSWA